MIKSLTILFVLALPFTAFIAADWKAVNDLANEGAKWELNVISSSDREIRVELTVPGYYEKKVMVGDVECVAIYIPECSMYMQRSFPMVPKITKLIQSPHDCTVKLEVISKEEEDVKLSAPIVPSKGHFTRDIDPETVPYEFGKIYKTDVFWPYEKEQFHVGKTFEFRDACGLRLQVLPVLANHVQMKMKVLKKAVLAIKFEHRVAQMANSTRRASANPNKTFRKMYREMFLNYAPEVSRTTESDRGTVPDANNRRLVVVTPTEYEGLLGEWVNWKRQSGYTVTIYSFDSNTDAANAALIKNYLQGLYNDVNTRFGYVVLIGDAAYTSNFELAKPMPTFKGKRESAAADRVYVRLAGNDNYPDAFISRISGNNATEISTQLSKIVAYERNPVDGSWLESGVCIASDQGSPTDKERAEWIQNGGGAGQKVPVLTGGLIGYGYKKFDDIYDPYAYASDVTNAVNEGRNIICYIGHGSSTSWGTTGFNVSDIKALSNGGMLPVIWSVACVNGQFVHTTECFGEAWLRKANGGAVAIECASTNESWVPPCDKQCATVNSIIQKTYFTFGALEAVGCVKALEVWGDIDSSEGNKLAEQCNLFGDCTLLVRTKKPATMTVQVSRDDDNSATFQVSTEGRSPEYAVVTIYSEDFSFMVSSELNNGTANLSLDNRPNVPLYYTVVGADMIPVLHQLFQ